MATISGIWRFESFSTDAGYTINQNINFVSNGVEFSNVRVFDGYILFQTTSGELLALYEEGSVNTEYEVLDFGATEQTVLDGFYDWLSANATRTGDSKEYSITEIEIDGILYKVKDSIARTRIKELTEEMKALVIPEGDDGTDSIVKRGTGENSVIINDLNTNTASGAKSFVGGEGNMVEGKRAFAFGYHNTISNTGNYSAAIGRENEVGANGAVAFGYGNKANYSQSAALGRGTNTSAEYQTVVGKYNKDDARDMFIVGGGSSDTDRKNAFSVRRMGITGGFGVVVGETFIGEDQIKSLLNLLNNQNQLLTEIENALKEI